jgi:hypothetical protein
MRIDAFISFGLQAKVSLQRRVGPIFRGHFGDTFNAVYDWRPFAGALSARSTAHALSILNALFRWLIEQRYVLANPFSGVKVRGAARAASIDATRAFTESEWQLIE